MDCLCFMEHMKIYTNYGRYTREIQAGAQNTGNPDNQGCIHFREVVHVDIEKIIEILVGLLAEQEKVTIEYTMEKPA